MRRIFRPSEQKRVGEGGAVEKLCQERWARRTRPRHPQSKYALLITRPAKNAENAAVAPTKFRPHPRVMNVAATVAISTALATVMC